MSSAAVTRLNQLIAEIRQQSPKTLAFWRLSNPKLVEALQEFAAGDDRTENDVLLDQVQALFCNKVNPLLAQQEHDAKGFARSASADCAKHEISVIFGGKYSKNPASISEVMVSKLMEQSPHVITVSRSSAGDASSSLPKNLTHIAKQNLDAAEGGVPEFVDVIKLAQDSFSSKSENDTATQRIAFYLTLGQHKGVNPFVRNLQAAQNFCEALQQTMETSKHQTNSWRVVLTGTDATLPSTHPDGKVRIDDNDQEFVVPSYKIMQYNYIYAMSKLGQYYTGVHTVASLLGRQEIVDETAPIMERIRKHVYDAGEDGDYHPESTNNGITMPELDDMSRRIVELAGQMSDHFRIATGIRICYTPLHAKPWTAAGLKTESPRGHVVEQIVRRLKNAISIEMATACHFPPPTTS
jgi:hypothetical protein